MSLLAAIILSMMLAGCSNSPEVGPADSAVAGKKELPSDADIVAEITGDRDSSVQHDEDILELRHWKYGVQPDYTSSYNSTVISYQLVSEEDMNRIVDRLIEGGYLSGQPEDEYQFKNALRQFQHDQGLQITGELDSATMKALLKDQDL